MIVQETSQQDRTVQEHAKRTCIFEDIGFVLYFSCRQTVVCELFHLLADYHLKSGEYM